jgi:hypothetical protein
MSTKGWAARRSAVDDDDFFAHAPEVCSMRFMILVRATPASESGSMPE